MKRTIKVTEIKACAMSVIEGKLNSRELTPVQYSGRKLTEVGTQKLFKKQLKEGESVFIVSSEEKERTYEMSLEKFMDHATLVEE